VREVTSSRVVREMSGNGPALFGHGRALFLKNHAIFAALATCTPPCAGSKAVKLPQSGVM